MCCTSNVVILDKRNKASLHAAKTSRVQMEELAQQHVHKASNGNIIINGRDPIVDVVENTSNATNGKRKRVSLPAPKTTRVQMEELIVQLAPNALDESIADVVDNTFDATNVAEKRGRGLTRGLNTQKYVRKCGEKPKIVIPRGVNKPIGEHSSKHATQIGVLIRLDAPMQVAGWAKIPVEEKEDLFRKLISYAKQYSTFRSNAHKHYQTIRDKSGVRLARQSTYEKLANRHDDWLSLCDFWETDTFKKISETQSNNRDKLKYSHKFGTKSRAAHQHENISHSLDDVDMYTVQFYNAKNGWSDKDAEAKSAQMKELKEQQQALPEGERMNAEKICITFLGENSSYAKSKGLNKKSSRSNVSLPYELSTSGARLEEELATTQADLASAKAELAIQKTTVEAVVKCVEKMTGRIFSEIIDTETFSD
ncbi:PREDICTED: uncharacterized protein LOC105958410 [Erythranthe guttata]|uniref:uncharacterized protein LOC105958410 n=1 Tax=Erythranthe guttata TaxID=4155 RepID=UPI00064E0326|nr:PREDICTED: uncharacterized protein LOC105958410 [Erythranthe guttata]|eukprot:XP_012837876.1 PREDICTED: uncharacterized protein LOC105958410 [Erythranthe guttata]